MSLGLHHRSAPSLLSTASGRALRRIRLAWVSVAPATDFSGREPADAGPKQGVHTFSAADSSPGPPAPPDDGRRLGRRRSPSLLEFPARYSRFVIGSVAIVLAVATPVTGQATLEERAPGACGTCISLELVAVLGSEREGETLTMTRAIALQNPHRVLVAQSSDGIKVFERSGQFVRSLGREGRGPGEFLDPFTMLAGSGDTVGVYDQGTGRLTWFVGDLDIVEEARLPWPGFLHAGVRLDDGTWVINVASVQAGLIVPPLRHVSSDFSEVYLEFGRARGESFDARSAYTNWRHITSGADGTVMVGKASRVPD